MHKRVVVKSREHIANAKRRYALQLEFPGAEDYDILIPFLQCRMKNARRASKYKYYVRSYIRTIG